MLLKSLSLSLETQQEDSANDTKMNSKELGVGILNEKPLTPELSLNEFSFIGPWGTRSRPKPSAIIMT